MTDRRFSRISKFMAETLYDENVGGPEGNTHVAIGNAFNESRKGDVANLTKEDLEKLGLNQSAEHVDIVSTAPRTVTATLVDGTEKVIYQNGEFCL